MGLSSVALSYASEAAAVVDDPRGEVDPALFAWAARAARWAAAPLGMGVACVLLMLSGVGPLGGGGEAEEGGPGVAIAEERACIPPKTYSQNEI